MRMCRELVEEVRDVVCYLKQLQEEAEFKFRQEQLRIELEE